MMEEDCVMELVLRLKYLFKTKVIVSFFQCVEVDLLVVLCKDTLLRKLITLISHEIHGT